MYIPTVDLGQTPAGIAALAVESMQKHRDQIEEQMQRFTPGMPMHETGRIKIEELDKAIEWMNRWRRMS